MKLKTLAHVCLAVAAAWSVGAAQAADAVKIGFITDMRVIGWQAVCELARSRPDSRKPETPAPISFCNDPRLLPLPIDGAAGRIMLVGMRIGGGRTVEGDRLS